MLGVSIRAYLLCLLHFCKACCCWHRSWQENKHCRSQQIITKNCS